MTPPDDAVGRPRRTTPTEGGRTPDMRASIEGGGLHRLLVESARDYAIFALDPDGHVLSWNAGAEHLKGLSLIHI